MVPIAIAFDSFEAAAASAAAAACALGASPEQSAYAVLVALRALPVAAASLGSGRGEYGGEAGHEVG